MPRDEDYTRKKLERFLPIMRASAVKAVRESMDDYVKTAPKHRKTTTRSITRDHLVDHLRGELMLDPNVSVKDKNQTTYFEIYGEFRILAKLGSESGKVALNSNQASFAFQDNEDYDLFASEDLPEATNLYLSYIPNHMDPREPFVWMICPKTGGHHWRFEIEPSAIAATAEIVSAPPDEADEIVRVPAQKKPEEDFE